MSSPERRSSRELARRLPYRRRPNADGFRRTFLLTGSLATIAGLVAWWGFGAVASDTQYSPGPLSSAHAAFGDRCAHCHEPFALVADDACSTCHAVADHHPLQVGTPACRTCHVEHRGDPAMVAATQAECVACHANLAAFRDGPAAVAEAIATFDDHPPFRYERTDADPDPGQVRFNHAVHLTSPDVEPPLACDDCHQPDATGAAMQSIAFQDYDERAPETGDPEAARPLRYCVECHEQAATGVETPFGRIVPLHAAPERIRAQLEREVAVLGVVEAERIFEGQRIRLPGRPPRLAIDTESKTWTEFQERWVGKIEAELYAPPAPEATTGNRYQYNKRCFLCHIEEGSERRAGLPAIRVTAIPKVWLPRAWFSHVRHEALACEACHGDMSDSHETSDVNLPSIEVCLACHADERTPSAGSDCALCHGYHRETASLREQPPPTLSLEVLSGHAAPGH